MYVAELWFSNKQCEGELKAFAINFHKALQIIVFTSYEIESLIENDIRGQLFQNKVHSSKGRKNIPIF
jgi:hypothetical protein